MRIESLAPETFVPKAMGNKDLPETEQFRVTVRFPTSEEYEPYAGQSIRQADAIGLVKKFTTKVENLEIGGEPIVDGATLVDQRRHVVAELVSEIFLYLVSGNEIGVYREKN